MVWSLALCHDDAKEDPVMYGAEFGVVFLAKGPRTASVQEGLDCLSLYRVDCRTHVDTARCASSMHGST